MVGTKVYLPDTFLYPLEVVEIFPALGSDVAKQQPLFKLKYWNRVSEGTTEQDEPPKLVTMEFYAIFESPFAGKFAQCSISKGERINDSQTPVCTILESCDHSVQYGGLCALCGCSLDDKDYMGYSETARAPIAMSHDTAGLTVSRNEAEKIENTSMQQLLKSKRLILVVDLDQTVIHCSVNQDVGHWIKDVDSPQHSLVKNVKYFTLKERQPNSVWYYVKIRPGLTEFLEKMHAKYEMHVYTMATKNYALEIAKLIDPEGKYFADRILSRDASENLLHKDLNRLFPVTTKMVTVIDDRGDVWSWSPHLVRCVPYQFWSGTGDINSQFLPHRNGLVVPEKNQAEVGEKDNDTELWKLGNVLERLHTKFYENPNSSDTAKLLPAMKSKAFSGCVLLFSGFFPLGTDLDNADIVQWVRSFGAVVVNDFLPSVTHVVAKNAGTHKVRQAAGYGKKIVSIGWVFACLDKWDKVPEDSYILEVKDPLPIDQASEKPHNEEEHEEVDSQIAEGFMRSLQRGDVNWSEMDEELKELLADEENEDSSHTSNGEDRDEPEPEDQDQDQDGDQDGEPGLESTSKNSELDGNVAEQLEDPVDLALDAESPALNNSQTNGLDPQSKKRKREEEVELSLSDFSDDWD